MKDTARSSRKTSICGVLVLFLYLCSSSLLFDLPSSNEISKFTDAMPRLESEWLPAYTPRANPFVDRQWLYQQIMAPLLLAGGFFEAAVVGRALFYLLLAVALYSLGRALSIRFGLIVLVVAAFTPHQSMVAREWIIGGADPKVVSYGLSLLALGLLLKSQQQLLLPLLLLGLSTSFHPLVGLYSLFCTVCMLISSREVRLPSKEKLKAAGIFLIGAVFAIPTVMQHLFSDRKGAGVLSSGFTDSYIYVYLRTPHHLDPWSWSEGWWMKVLAILLVVLLLSRVLKSSASSDAAPHLLVCYAVASMIPFLIGLGIRPFDTQGVLLRYYLFRFADVIVPLSLLLLVAVTIERFLLKSYRTALSRVVTVVVIGVIGIQVPPFLGELEKLERFPVSSKRVSEEWHQTCFWARGNTPQDAVFLTNPLGSETFPWLARRRFVGTFKQVPMSGGLQQWYQTMTLIGELEEPWRKRGFALSRQLRSQYEDLSTERVQWLMEWFSADYFVTSASHSVDLPIAYRNSEFNVYQRSKSQGG